MENHKFLTNYFTSKKSNDADGSWITVLGIELSFIWYALRNFQNFQALGPMSLATWLQATSWATLIAINFEQP